LNLPILNGFEFTQKLREHQFNVPVLMLTALGTTDDKLKGFDVGADDYLVKPFEFRELLARIKVLLKRNTETRSMSGVLKLADLEMNLDEKIVRRNGIRIELSAKEFSLLEYMLRNQNRVLSRVEIAEKVWDIHFDTGTNTIDVYVNFLRKKIDKEFELKLIQTVTGMGYVLRTE
jgi:two-component system copper resistance phosphate regulon response regulator CusR